MMMPLRTPPSGAKWVGGWEKETARLAARKKRAALAKRRDRSMMQLAGAEVLALLLGVARCAPLMQDSLLLRKLRRSAAKALAAARRLRLSSSQLDSSTKNEQLVVEVHFCLRN